MRKIIATALAALTLVVSLTGIDVAPAEARDRQISFRRNSGGMGANRFFHARNWNGANRFIGGSRFYGFNRGYRGYRYHHAPIYYGYGGPRYYGYGPSYYDYGPGYDGYYGYDDGYDGGAAIAGGIIGLATGALLGGALNHPYSYGGSCAARFRSYDPASGTYLGRDGYRHPCR